MTRLEHEQRRYVWLHNRLLFESHDRVCETLVENGVTGAVMLPNTYSQWHYPTKIFPAGDIAAFPRFIETAHSYGLKVIHLITVGKWDRFKSILRQYPPEWNARLDTGLGINEDWLNLARADVRETIADIVDEALALDTDAILLDYIRWPSGNGHLHDHVTRTILAARGRMLARGSSKELFTTCFRRHSPTGRPPNENVGQLWPDWLRDDLVDHVFVTVYKDLDDFQVNLLNIPVSDSVSPKIRSTGEDQTGGTVEELDTMFQIVEDERHLLPVIWNYELMTPELWGVVRERYSA